MDTKITVLCPACGHGICHANHLDNALVCQRCKATYPKLNGVIDMLRGAAIPRSFAQRCLEFPLLIWLRESRVWRRNPLLERLSQISFRQEADSILEAASLKGNERVLDLACGTGHYARLLAKQVSGGEVLAVDLSLSLLEYGACCARQEGLSNLQFMRADALTIPLADNSVDVINCCGALHLFRDVDQVLAEIQRVLKPGGRFTTAVFRNQKGWFTGGMEWMGHQLQGAKSFSTAWLMVRLHKAGLDEGKPYQSGRMLVMRSTKSDPSGHQAAK